MNTRAQKMEGLLENFRLVHRTVGSRASLSDDITPAQWGVLMFIEQHGSCSLRAVAEALGISSPAATQLTDGLVDAGLVARRGSTRDRRTVELTLSGKARSRVRTARRKVIQTFLGAFKILTDAEFDRYCALTRKIAGTMQKTGSRK
jgi:DNA-binding MarR family transcriptional regulator